MTDANNKDVNKNILENIPTFDQIPNTDLETEPRNNEHVSAEVESKISDGECRNNDLLEHANNSVDIFQSKDQQEEDDVPESFFDDFMNEDFIEGLNVVDTWEGDDIIRTDFTRNSIEKKDVSDKSVSKHGKLPRIKRDKARSSKDKLKKDKKHKEDRKNRDSTSKRIQSSFRSREQKRSRRSKSSPLGIQQILDSNNRRDPSKTQRDIQRDKDKCEKDKNTKILHEKLKVVETGLVPPGMEMEMEVLSSNKVSKLEEGEISDKEPNSDKCRRSKSLENRRNRPESSRYSSTMKSAGRRNLSPDFKRDFRRIRSRSRSIKRIGSRSRSLKKRNSRSRSIKHLRSRSRSIKRLRSRSRSIKRLRSRSRSIIRKYSPRARSRSTERRIDRRRSHRRTRSRSLDFLAKYKDRSPLRKKSPLSKRNQQLFQEINVLRAKLYSNDGTMDLLSPGPRNIEHDLMNKPTNMTNMDIVQNPLNNLGPYTPVPAPNQNFVPLQPVPPPQQSCIELDQQFFIGQQASMEQLNPYATPMSQPQIMHNTVMQPIGVPELQQDFQQNWIMEQSQQQQNNYFNPMNQFSIEQSNPYQAPMCPSVSQPPPTPVAPSASQHLGLHSGPLPGQHSGLLLSQQAGQLQFVGNMMTPQKEVPFFSTQQQKKRTPPIPVANMGQEEELFAKMFADNKITLSDYLSVSAKSTDNSSPGDVQNKIKVISHCQEALNELIGNAKNMGKFRLRKSQKSISKEVNSDGLSPFKKVPVIKFQFTTYVKPSEEKPQLASYLNRLMHKLHKNISFQERTQSPAASLPKSESNRESRKAEPRRTVSVSVQTDPVAASDFGCQVSFEEGPSPAKNTFKKQSLAKLTPAQLLAQAEMEVSPPPAPRWNTFEDAQVDRRTGNYRDSSDANRRNFESAPAWPNPTRSTAANFFDRSLAEIQDIILHGQRY